MYLDCALKWQSEVGLFHQDITLYIQQFCYLTRMCILNREAGKLWPGNAKVHIKGNTTSRLKLEEFVTQKEKTCCLPEIGFGRGEQEKLH